MFEPKGEESRWRIVYKLLAAAEPDDVVTYKTMADVLDLDPDEHRHGIQMAVRRAADELEIQDNKAVTSIPNRGYRILRVDERIPAASKHQRKAGRSLERGRRKVEHVDFNDLDPATRRALELVAAAFRAQSEFNARLDIRSRKLEKRLAAVAEHSEHTSEELDDLRRRLERLEAERD